MRTFGRAWVLLCLALALHVADEALTGFLSVYNPTVERIRERFPFLPLPVFSFRVWLAGLIVAVVLLLLLSRFAVRGSRWMRWFAAIFSVLMVSNGLAHIVGSLWVGRPLPGVLSAPFLLAAALHVLWRVGPVWRASPAR